MNKIHLFLTDYHDIIFIFVALNGFRIMAKINIDLAVVLHDDCDYKDWLVELKKRFYSHRLKASCATNGYFYKLYAPLQANCPQLADNFIEDLYIVDIQRVVVQSKNNAIRSPLDFAKQIKDMEMINILTDKKSKF